MPFPQELAAALAMPTGGVQGGLNADVSATMNRCCSSMLPPMPCMCTKRRITYAAVKIAVMPFKQKSAAAPPMPTSGTRMDRTDVS